MVQPLWKTVGQILKMSSVEFHDPKILLLGMSPREMKTHVHINSRIQMFRAALVIIVKKYKQPKCPSADEQMRKRWCILTMDHYLAITRNEVLIQATNWMYLENTVLSERRQSQRTNIVLLPLHEMSIISKPIETERRLVVAVGGRG